MVIFFLWCPANVDEVLSFVNSQTTCQRRHWWLQQTKTLGRFFTSSCLLFSLNLLIRAGPNVSERWRLVTPKTGAAYQWNIVISRFLPLKCTKAGARLSLRVCARAPEPWVRELCSPPLPGTCRDSPGNMEKPRGFVGLFVSTKAYVFPGEMLLMLWNST